ncbi:TonB family protein [Aquisalinus flavus]|nr:TonB family protein [Aquisalinus flavus]MBD0427853.1 TonB family protein [Aquisalinus flavus]UNE47619.1 TonB family protein [Aquisalinus flavus]
MSSVADVVELDEERVKRGSVKDDTFESAGAMLRAARESRKLSIEDVSGATNIREVHLAAIEAMDIGKLPVAAYTTGFVKVYAQLLELPVEALVNRFREEAGYARSSIAPQVNMPARRELAGGKELSLLAVVAILAFIIWVAWQVLREPQTDGPVQIAGTPLQERPIDARTASNGGANEVPVARPQPNTNVEPIPGMPTNETQVPTGLDAAAVDLIANGETEAVSPAVSEGGEPAPGQELAQTGDGPESLAADGATAQADATAETLPTETLADATADAPADDLSADPVAPVDEPVETEIAPAETAAAQPENDALDASDTGLASATDVIDETAQAIVGQAAPEAMNGDSMTGDGAGASETPEVAQAVYTEPVSTARVSPIYPRRCERLSSGTEAVVVTYDISSRGAPVNVRVTETTNECFNAAAISAVSRWSFDPATRNGNPIPVYTRSTRFRFELPQ